MSLIKRCFTIVFFAMLFSISQRSAIAQKIPFESDKWIINARESRIENYMGEKSLYLKGGIAYIKDEKFKNGIIEFDIAFSPERTFLYAMFRMQDTQNHEEFYIRTHLSDFPDAMQYTPVYNGVSGWQLYHGEGFNAETTYAFDQWMHVKLVISGGNAEVYIGDNEKPVLFMHDLKRETKQGMVGLKASNLAGGRFANFTVTKMDKPILQTQQQRAKKEVKKGTVMSWFVSGAFDEKNLDNKFLLNERDKKFKWEKLICEASGLANLARIGIRENDNNTVFAKVNINSDKAQIKKISFGYSDRVKVYLNDRLIYGGNNTYLTRDYRYLGTIGYFDELYLPLKKGKNEIWLAVSENFGGWGIIWRFEDMSDIKINH